MAKNTKYVTQKDLGALINNAVFSVLRTPYFQDLEDSIGKKKADARKDRLRAYTEGHLKVVRDHLNEGVINPDEAILVLLSGALLIAGLHYKNVKLPMFADLASRLLEDDELDFSSSKNPEFGDE